MRQDRSHQPAQHIQEPVDGTSPAAHVQVTAADALVEGTVSAEVEGTAVQEWRAYRWNSQAANIFLARRVFGPFADRDLARTALLFEITKEINGWRSTNNPYGRTNPHGRVLLPKLRRVHAILRDNSAATIAVVDGLRFGLLSPEQQSCEHLGRFFFCDCLSEE